MPLFSKEYFVEYCSVKRNDCCSGKACSAIKNGELQLRIVLRSQNSQLIKFLHLRCVSQDLANMIKTSCPLEIAPNLSGHDALRVQQLFDCDENSNAASNAKQAANSDASDKASRSNSVTRSSPSPAVSRTQPITSLPSSSNAVTEMIPASPKIEALKIDSPDSNPLPENSEAAKSLETPLADKIAVVVPETISILEVIQLPQPVLPLPLVSAPVAAPPESVVEAQPDAILMNVLPAAAESQLVNRVPKEQKISIRLFDSTNSTSAAVPRIIPKLPTKVTLRTENLQIPVTPITPLISGETANSLSDTTDMLARDQRDESPIFFSATSAAAAHLAEELKNQISEASEMEKKMSNWTITGLPKKAKSTDFNGPFSVKIKFNPDPSPSFKRESTSLPDVCPTRAKRAAEDVFDDDDDRTLQHDSSDAATWVSGSINDRAPIADAELQPQAASANGSNRLNDGEALSAPASGLKAALRANSTKRPRRNI